MRHAMSAVTKIGVPKTTKLKWYIILLISVMGSAVLQDLIFSKLKGTGFYLSESLLYNSFWLFFLPLVHFTSRLAKTIRLKSKILKGLIAMATAVVIGMVHLVLFTSFFIFISNLYFSPPHRFSAIFNSVLSNHFYICILVYTLTPVIGKFLITSKKLKSGSAQEFPQKLVVKIGTRNKLIDVEKIQLITTDKPYSVVCTKDKRFLKNESLKELEVKLDPDMFMRVHRSTIVNKKYIKQLRSRKNGDYDAYLENGPPIRLSRHFRHNWNTLLH